MGGKGLSNARVDRLALIEPCSIGVEPHPSLSLSFPLLPWERARRGSHMPYPSSRATLPPGWGAVTVLPAPRRRRGWRLAAAAAIALAAIAWAIWSR
jgi:hypothetical protein